MSSAMIVPVTPATTFFWTTANDSVTVIPQCVPFLIQTVDNPGSPVSTVPPLFLNVIPVGQTPQGQATNAGIGNTFTWLPNYPVGTQLTMAMSDSAGNSGGAVGPYQIGPGYSNCTISNSTSPLDLSFDPDEYPCGELDLKLTGGTAPYTISIAAPRTGVVVNVTNVQTSKVKMQNIVSPGQNFTLFFTDSMGRMSDGSDQILSGLNSPGCRLPASSEPPASKAPIIGGVVGGLAGAIAILALAWYIWKRKGRDDESLHKMEGEEPTEFRQADGKVPHIAPFILNQDADRQSVIAPQTTQEQYASMPPQTPSSSGGQRSGYSEHGGSSGENSTAPLNAGGYGRRYSPPPPSSAHAGSFISSSPSNSRYFSGFADSSTQEGSSEGWPTYDTALTQQRQEYLTAQRPAPPRPAAGLANPDDFAYRTAPHPDYSNNSAGRYR